MQNKSFLERLMRMSDDVWERHTNPWSGWSRMAIPPLFALAVWSRDWVGAWSLLSIALVGFWIWANPRVFPPPQSTDNWMSKAVLGERQWLDRKRLKLPSHHQNVPLFIAVASGIGLFPFAWGLWHLEIWPALSGLILILGGKLWFLDRMVWLLSTHPDQS